MAFSFFFMEHPLVGGYTPDKVALRRAVSLAFDGEAYIRHVMGGQPCRRSRPSRPSPGLRRGLQDRDERPRPGARKALLDLYGYTDRDGDGYRETPDGARWC